MAASIRVANVWVWVRIDARSSRLRRASDAPVVREAKLAATTTRIVNYVNDSIKGTGRGVI